GQRCGLGVRTESGGGLMRFARGKLRLAAAIAIWISFVVVPSINSNSATTTPPPPDTCGYPTGTGITATTFNESTVMRWAQVYGQGLSATIGAFANDEKALLLGVRTATSLTPTLFASASATNLFQPLSTVANITAITVT